MLMQRQISEIVPLTNLIFVIGTYYFQKGTNKFVLKLHPPFFIFLAESGSGKSTFIKLMIKNFKTGDFMKTTFFFIDDIYNYFVPNHYFYRYSSLHSNSRSK